MMHSTEHLLTRWYKVKHGDHEDFLAEHHALLSTILVLIDEFNRRGSMPGQWFEVFEPLIYQVVSFSYAVVNSLDGNVHGKYTPAAASRPDISITFTLARAQLEAYLTFFYLFIQPQSDEEHLLRYQLYVASGLSMRQGLVTAKQPDQLTKMQLEKERIDDYRNEIGTNRVFTAYRNDRQRQLLTEHPKKPARVKGWEQLIDDSRLQSDLFKKSWSLYSNHAHAEYIGLIQTRSYLLNPSDAIRLRPHTLHKSLMVVSALIRDLVEKLDLEEAFQAIDEEIREEVTFWNGFSASRNTTTGQQMP